MNRTQKFSLNSTSAVLQQIVIFVAGMVTPRVILASYGSEINGLITSLTQFFSYFTLVEAGLAEAAVFALYKPLAQKNTQGTNAILVATRNLYRKSGYIFLLLMVALSIIYPMYIQTESLNKEEISILVFVLGVSGCIDFFTLSKYRALLTADQRLYVINVAGTLYQIVNAAIIVSLSYLHCNIIILRIIALVSVLLRSMILILYCKKNYPYINFSVKPNNRALEKRWAALYLQILGVVHSGVPIIIITLLLKDLKLTSVYSVYNLVIAGIGGVVGVFTNGLPSAFGEIIAKREDSLLQKIYHEFEVGYYTIITVIYSVAFIMIESFVKLYTRGITDTNYNLPMLGFLFVLNGFLYNLKTPQGMLIISAGHYRETRVQVTIQASIAVLGSTLLATFIGIYGVLLGAILSNAYRNIDLLFYVPKHITKTSWKDSATHMFCSLASSLIIILPSLQIDIPINSYLSWVIMASIYTLYAMAVTAMVMYLSDKSAFKNAANRLWILVKRKA